MDGERTYMKFEKVVIKNFRNFDNVELDLSNKNIFFGLNDVGKTNFLYALRYVFDKDLNEKKFYWGYYHGTEENRWIHGSLNTYNPYCWGNWGYEPRYPGHIYKKSLHGIKNNQLKRSGFHELVRKSETVEPVAYFHRLKQYPYLEQLAKSGYGRVLSDILRRSPALIKRKLGKLFTASTT